MYLYWRIQQDLEASGLSLILHHPNLSRAFRRWVRKNRGGLALTLDWHHEKLPSLCFSRN